MTKQAERKLHQLSWSLGSIERKFPLSQRQLEALRKAGLSLCLEFIQKLDSKMEEDYTFLKVLDKKVNRVVLRNKKSAKSH